MSLCWILGLFLAHGMLNHQLVNGMNEWMDEEFELLF